MSGNLGDRIEQKLRKYAISNLSLYILICSAIGYAIQLIPNGDRIISAMTLEPVLILHGQVWRLVTWIFCMADKSNILFIAISLYFYYSIGRTLENVWGPYRYNVYMFSGMFYTLIGAFVMYGILVAIGHGDYVGLIGSRFTTYYVCMSIFLAFAATFPDMEILMMFVLPIKVKYLGILYAVLMAAECLQGGIWVTIPIVASLFNFIVFFFTGRKRIRISREQQKQRAQFRAKIKQATREQTRHKCAICGKTEATDPDLSFRFCSKCNGNYEYCENHLFTHKHIE